MQTFTVRFPQSCHAKMKEWAQAEGISMHQFLVIAVAEKMAALVSRATC